MKIYNFITKLTFCALLLSGVLPTNSSASASSASVGVESHALGGIQKELTDAVMTSIEQLKNADASGSAAAIEKAQSDMRKLDQELMVVELLGTPFTDAGLMQAQEKVSNAPRDKALAEAFMTKIKLTPEGQEAFKQIMLQHMQDSLMPTQLRYNNLEKAGASEDVLKVVKKELENTKEVIETLGGKDAEDAAEKRADAFEKLVEKSQEQEDDKSEEESESSEKTDGKSYQQYREEQRQARAELPVRSASGALTGQGQLQALEQRQARETALRVQNSILANNSLPTESNRDEWVRLFVETYESPYVMSQLSSEEKAQYINILSDFFKNAKDDIDAEKAAELYDKLSDKLHDAIKPRLMPFIESRMQELGAELDEVEQVVKVQTQQAEQTEAAAQANPSDAGLRAKADTAKAALESTKKKGYSLATKIAGAVAIAALVTVGSAFVYATVTGQTTGAVLSSLGAAAAGTRPGQMVVGGAQYVGSTRAGQAIGTALGGAGSALGKASGAVSSAAKTGAQWAGSKALGLGMSLGATAVMNKASAFLGYGAAPAAAPATGFSPEQYDAAVSGYSSAPVVPQAAPIIDLEQGGRMVN